MSAPSEAEYRLRLAEGFLAEARQEDAHRALQIAEEVYALVNQLLHNNRQ